MNEFLKLYNEIGQRMEREKKIWLDKLHKLDVAAVHPDDGWVNRNVNEVYFCYPYYYRGVSIGSIVALGEPSKFRLVRITGSRTSILGMVYWQFEEIEEDVKQVGNNG